MRKTLFLLLILFIASCEKSEQKKFNYNGITINLDNLPLNGEYIVPLDNSQEVEGDRILLKQSVFVSENKKYFVVVSSFQYTKPYKILSVIKLLNIHGNLIWELNRENFKVLKCEIGQKGNIVHVIWYPNSDIPDIYELKSYDSAGKQIFSDNSSAIYSSGDKLNIFYLDANEYPKVKLAYRNFISGDSWVKVFNDNVKSIYDISFSNKRLLLGIDKLYCINEKAEIIWESSHSSYYASISDNGDKVLNLIRPGQLQLSSIENGNILFEKNSFSEINPQYEPNKCTFIKNSNDYYALSGVIGPLKTLVVIFNNSNEKIKEVIVEGKRLTKDLELIQVDRVTEIYFDGLKVYSF